MAYRSEDRRDRWKAVAGVVLVHVVLGAAILTGLNVNIVGEAVDRLETFDVSLPEAPPPPPPPPPEQAQEEQGTPPAPKASPVVAPEPEVQLPVQNPIAAAPEPGTGSSLSAGQGGAGTGTGAGGTGTGAGRGDGTGTSGTPARLVRNLTNSDYRSLTGNGLRRGSAALALHVDTQGRVDGCRVIRSSGDSMVDVGICALVSRRLRFAPARNARGQPVPYLTNYMARWNRR
ncbi:MAG: energy transducer TonB [Sphingomicrobium sp.]